LAKNRHFRDQLHPQHQDLMSNPDDGDGVGP
jgi:hypothetical protein